MRSVKYLIMKYFILASITCLICQNLRGQSLSFNSMGDGTTITRGKYHEVSWSGGSPEDVVTVSLIAKRKSPVVLNTFLNSGKGRVFVPARTRAGRCTVTIAISGDPSAVVTHEFTVKRRVPLVVQISPLAIVPLAFLFTRDETHRLDPPAGVPSR